MRMGAFLLINGCYDLGGMLGEFACGVTEHKSLIKFVRSSP
jgi:hypothetical protein